MNPVVIDTNCLLQIIARKSPYRPKTTIRLQEADGQLPMNYRPHKLSGQYGGSWECHLNYL